MRFFVSPPPHDDNLAVSGTLCLPRADSYLTDPTVRHPEWQLVTCPVCGDECYISPDRRQTLSTFPNIMAGCTRCALAGKGGKFNA